MGFTIPNEDDVAYEAQAKLDAGDFAILVAGIARTGVVSGCAVTAQGTPNMTVAVAAGEAAVGGVSVTVAAGNVTITPADASDPRFDLVVVNAAGVKSAVAGTPRTVGVGLAGPEYPAIPANSVVLATVYVPAAAVAITSGLITDKRVTVFLAGG